MLAVFVILLFTVYLVFFFPMTKKAPKEEEKSPKYKAQMKKLWQVAQTSMKERKPFRAEKALLTILKFDEKNAAAYNRLGILYAKSQKYTQAVECFEIAQSLDNNPASIHNVGLIYLETGAYEKAAMAFQQAIKLEGDVPARYIALAKAEEKMGNNKKAIEALENAYELDPKTSTLRQILAIYEGMGDAEAVTATAARVEAQIVKETEAKKRRATTRARGAAAKKTAARTRSMTARRTVTRSGASTTATRGTTKNLPKAKTAPKVIKTHAGRKRI
ncbi:tetratricopeptide repeat protein [Candidatus Saccharibacteria bacterium]|nr:tetratricopeptide repeat protein [Candidatus Saccharibacteria bacterium]